MKKDLKIKPVRIQRKRSKGFNLQKASPNGLEVISVTRPSKWGNPYKIGEKYKSKKGLIEIKTVQQAVDLHKESVLGIYQYPISKKEIKQELKGKNLACFCPLDSPCHADILLEIANQ